MPTKTELFAELKRLQMQIEHFEAQVSNTFGLEKEEHQKKLRYLWEQTDMLLDQYNYQKKFKPGVDKD